MRQLAHAEGEGMAPALKMKTPPKRGSDEADSILCRQLDGLTLELAPLGRMPQVIGSLRLLPRLRGAAKRRSQAQRHVSAHR